MKKKKDFLFNKSRYRLLIISILVISIGFLLMSGGASDNPEVFNFEIYNFRRIRLAPLIVILGFILCIFTILTKNKN
tara:strand:+ start:1618 stop:1848 length:231 start_codon:yes stop_codon:yes gene_type:complete